MPIGDLADEDDEEEGGSSEVEVLDQEEAERLPAPTPEAQNSLVQPVENIDEVVELYDQFEEIKEKLLDKEDTTQIPGGGIHVNKSGWRKIATAFNLSIETLGQEMWVEEGVVKARVTARATAPNGKVSVGVGMCGSNEANFMEAGSPEDGEPEDHPDYYHIEGKWRKLPDPREVKEHNVLTIAETRAKNRAISDCVGGGEVSAEEISAEDVFN